PPTRGYRQNRSPSAAEDQIFLNASPTPRRGHQNSKAAKFASSLPTGPGACPLTFVTVARVPVRRVRPEEWQELRAIRLRPLEDAPVCFGSTAFEARRRNDEEWQAWATTGGASADSAVFVAVEEGAMIGLCGSFLHAGDSRVAQIVAMWVDPHHRGRRLGEQL